MKKIIRLFASAALCAALSVSCTKKSTEAVAGKLTGELTIAPELAAKLKPDTDVLYIIVRREQVGPPAAVKRITKPQFPLKYVVGPEDSMMPGMSSFNGDPLTVAARISRTGNAMPGAGDLEGVFKNNPAKPGDAGVDIVIDRERQ